jgi:hypothetical protein
MPEIPEREIPERVLTKIQSYENVLITRYPPTIVFYKLSARYDSSKGASDDNVPISSMFTQESRIPNITGRIIYIDQNLKNPFNGTNGWFNVFESDGTELGFVIQIGTKGAVLKVI